MKNKSQKTYRVPNYIYDKNSNNNRRSLSKNFSPQEKEFIKNPNKKIGGQGKFRPNILSMLEKKNLELKNNENNPENKNQIINNINNSNSITGTPNKKDNILQNKNNNIIFFNIKIFKY